MYCLLSSGEDGYDHNIKKFAACGHRNSEAKLFHPCADLSDSCHSQASSGVKPESIVSVRAPSGTLFPVRTTTHCIVNRLVRNYLEQTADSQIGGEMFSKGEFWNTVLLSGWHHVAAWPRVLEPALRDPTQPLICHASSHVLLTLCDVTFWCNPFWTSVC